MKNLEESYPELFAETIKKIADTQFRNTISVIFIIIIILSVSLGVLFKSPFLCDLLLFILGAALIATTIIMNTEDGRFSKYKFFPFGKITKKMMRITYEKEYFPSKPLELYKKRVDYDNTKNRKEKIKKLELNLAKLKTPKGQKLVIEREKKEIKEKIKKLELNLAKLETPEGQKLVIEREKKEYKKEIDGTIDDVIANIQAYNNKTMLSFLEELYKE